MNPKLLLRIAAIFMLLHAIGHSFGALGWKKAPNEAIGRVIDAMQSNHFTFMGRSTSFADFYEGYGITMIFVLLLISFLLWFLSYETSNALAAKLLLPMTVFLMLLVVAEYVYFFPFAAIFTFVAGICALLARIRIGMQE
jgi:hypothetical protein